MLMRKVHWLFLILVGVIHWQMSGEQPAAAVGNLLASLVMVAAIATVSLIWRKQDRQWYGTAIAYCSPMPLALMYQTWMRKRSPDYETAFYVMLGLSVVGLVLLLITVKTRAGSWFEKPPH